MSNCIICGQTKKNCDGMFISEEVAQAVREHDESLRDTPTVTDDRLREVVSQIHHVCEGQHRDADFISCSTEGREEAITILRNLLKEAGKQ